MHMYDIRGDGDDDDKDNSGNSEERDPKTGDYDLGDAAGTRIGEHDEDPSL